MELQKIRPYVLPCLLLVAAFSLKWWYRTASEEQLQFMLGPVAMLVTAFTGVEHGHVAGQGYYFAELNVLVDRSCSGLNFLIITTATFAFVLMRRPRCGCFSPFLSLLAILAAYVVTLLANSGRIVAMVQLQRIGLHLGPTAHEALGAFFFLILLLLASLALDRSLSTTTSFRAAIPKNSHAQFT